jgi:nucleotide-binding universal stress UspA family protein
MELLVCVDGSAKSRLVVERGIDLSRKLSSKILLMYVARDEGVPEAYSEYAATEKVDLASYYETVGEAVLAKLTEQLVKSGVQFETLLDLGNPAGRIIEVARARNVQMIILGLQGLHGLGRVRSLGSVSRRVIENAPCPVVVVHEDMEELVAKA